jgi:hypothetical protein
MKIAFHQSTFRRVVRVSAAATAIFVAAGCGGERSSGREARAVDFLRPSEPVSLLEIPRTLIAGEFDGDSDTVDLLAVYDTDPWGEILTSRDGGPFRRDDVGIVNLRALLPPSEGEPALGRAVALPLDGDHLLDLALLDGNSGQFHILKNEGRGVFTHLWAAPAPWGSGPPGQVLDISAADFDRDGNVDFVLSTPGAIRIYYRRPGMWRWRRDQRPIPIDDGANLIRAGMILQHRGADFLTISDEDVGLVRRNTNWVFIRDEEHHIALAGITDAVLADLNGDQFQDMVFVRPGEDELALWLVNIDRAWVENRPARVRVPEPRAVTSADVNRDGSVDLIVASPSDIGVGASLRVIFQESPAP